MMRCSTPWVGLWWAGPVPLGYGWTWRGGLEPLFDDLDISRTAGFTSLYPVALKAGDAGPGAVRVSAKDRLRAVPGRGIAMVCCVILEKPVSSKRLRRRRSCSTIWAKSVPWTPTLLFQASTVSAGPAGAPRAHRTYLLAIDGVITEGRLRITLTYGSRVHRRETMEWLAAAYADTLRQLIQHGRESREVSMASGPGRGGAVSSGRRW